MSITMTMTPTSTIAWVIGSDKELMDKVTELLSPLSETVERMPIDILEIDNERLKAMQHPSLLVLDISDEVEKGVSAIKQLKRLRINAPLVVITDVITRDFGARIISQGVRYYFARNFDSAEFCEVAGSYLKGEKHSPHQAR